MNSIVGDDRKVDRHRWCTLCSAIRGRSWSSGKFTDSLVRARSFHESARWVRCWSPAMTNDQTDDEVQTTIRIVRKSPSSSLWRELACNRVNSTGITTSNETTGMRGTTRKPRKVGTLACHRVDRRPGAALSTRRRTAPTSRRRRRRRLGDHATSRSSPLWWTKRKRRRRRRRVFRSIEPVRLRCSARYRYVEREEKTRLCCVVGLFLFVVETQAFSQVRRYLFADGWAALTCKCSPLLSVYLSHFYWSSFTARYLLTISEAFGSLVRLVI